MTNSPQNCKNPDSQSGKRRVKIKQLFLFITLSIFLGLSEFARGAVYWTRGGGPSNTESNTPQSSDLVTEKMAPTTYQDKRSNIEKIKDELIDVLAHPNKVSAESYNNLVQAIKRQQLFDKQQVPKGFSSLGFIGLIAYLMNKNKVGFSMFVDWVVRPFFAPLIKNIFYSGSYLTKGSLQSKERNLQINLDIYEQYFELNKLAMPEFTQIKIEKNIIEIGRSIKEFASPPWLEYGMKSDQTILESLAKLEKILLIPFGKATAVKDLQTQKLLFKKYLETYDQYVAEELLAAFSFTARSSTAPRALKNGSVLRPNQHYYFIGNPGVGKTVSARFFAKTLGLPFCEMGLKDLFEEFTPKQQNFGVNTFDPTVLPIGRITKCFIEPDNGIKGMNPIIFIDEADRSTNSEKTEFIIGELLKLLNSGQAYFYDKHLDIHVPLTQVTFVLSGNKFIKDNSNAFGDRIKKIIFPDLTIEQKVPIAINTFKEFLSQDLGRPVTNQELSLYEEKLNEIAKYSADIKESGVRSLERVVGDFIYHIRIDGGTIEEFNVVKAYQLLN